MVKNGDVIASAVYVGEDVLSYDKQINGRSLISVWEAPEHDDKEHFTSFIRLLDGP